MDTDTLPAPAETEPLFVEPTAADAAPRKRAAAAAKPVAHDPEAPYGWTTDRATGERRPKKTAGRQPKGGAGRAVPEPRKRAANKPRVAASVPSADPDAPPIQPASHAEQVGDLVDGVWMVAAAFPVVDKSIFGVHVGKLAIRAKAVAAVLRDTKGSTMQGIGEVADHVPAVGKAVQWLTGDSGGWMLTAMLCLVPAAVALGEVVNAPLDEIQHLAQRTDQEWKAFIAQQAQAQRAAQQARTIDGTVVEPGATYPGEVPLPGMGG